MLNRNVSILVCVCLAVSVAAVAQDQGNEYLFQYATPPNTSTQFVGYNAVGSTLSPFVSANGPTGIAQIIPKPDGSKFYLVGSTGTSPVQSVDSAFSTYHQINGIGAAPTAAAMTPDGNYLLIGADYLYVISTSTDTVVASLQMPGIPNFVNGQTLANGSTGLCMSCWIAVSHDAQTAYVLTNFGGGQISSYNLSSMSKIAQYNFPFGDLTSIGISPLGALYAAGGNALYQLNPANLTLISQTSISFTPGPLHFSADGTTMFATNLTPSSGGKSLMMVTLSTGAASFWPGTNGGISTPIEFDDVYVASGNRLFAYSSNLTTLYDVTVSPFAAAVSTSLILPLSTVQNVLAVAISNEVPARDLFLLVANGNQTNLYRMNLSSNASDLSPQLASLNSGVMQFAEIPPNAGPASFLQFNNNQNVTAGTVSAPLIMRVLNALGQPVFGQSVQLTTDPTTGTTITAPNLTTNADGYAQTTFTAPTNAGTYNITATAGAAATTFTFTVPCTGTGCTGSGTGTGTGTGTTIQPISIISGDGQLLEAENPALLQVPLTVLVVDSNGNPLSAVPVTFSIGNPAAGNAYPQTATTGTNGQASTYFYPNLLAVGGFQTTSVTAAIPSGATVNFSESAYQPNIDNTGQPDIEILSPGVGGFPIVLPEGTPVPNAITAQIYSGALYGNSGVPAPITGVSIFIQAFPDPTQPAPAQCQGSSEADQNGISHCTLIAACPTGGVSLVGQTIPITVNIGNFATQSGSIKITSGGATNLTIVSGNNQSGVPGAALQPLVAQVTDGCGVASPGAQVTWTVTQGSAVLSHQVTTTNASGQVSTSVAFGQTPGTVTVKVTLGSTSATFTLTNQVVVGGISLVSGSGQSVMAGQAFPTPLTFQVTDTHGNPLSGIVVTFTASGSVTVNPASATTGASGQVSTTATAGSSSGAAGVTATAGTFTASVSLTVQPQGPSITASSFANAASFAQGLVPCGLGVVTGNGIATGITGVISGLSSFGPMSLQVAGFSMTVNGVPAPISSVSNENGIQQATFQTPCETGTSGPATVVTTINNVPTTITGVPVFPAQPGIFTFQGTGGFVYGAVIRAADGSYVTSASPAHRGETYYLVVTGLGQTTPPASTNTTGTGQNVNATLVIGVNNAGVAVTSAQYATGLIGVYLVGFQIPTTNPTGTNVPLSVATIVNGQVTYGNSVFLPGVI